MTEGALWTSNPAGMFIGLQQLQSKIHSVLMEEHSFGSPG